MAKKIPTKKPHLISTNKNMEQTSRNKSQLLRLHSVSYVTQKKNDKVIARILII